MKKLGIMTFYNAHNYGAMLQALALQDFFKNSQNIDTYIINYRNPIIDNRYKLNNWKSKKLKQIIKNIYKIIFYSKKFNKRNQAFESFIKNNFVLTKPYLTEQELKEDYPKFDYYVTGSDQVWNYKITNNVEDAYVLNFGDENIIRFSYAASIGNDNIESKYNDIYKEKLKKLDMISVRENSAKIKLEGILKRDIFETIDPTLLVKREYWEEKLKCKEIREKEKYILAYQVDPNSEYNKIVNYISQKLGYKVIHFERRNNNYKNILRSAYTEGPLEFINLIKNAEFVINTSFHGTVFSTIFHKKFLVIPHTETGSRMIDYTDKIGLHNRIVYKLEDLNNIDFNETINYNNVERILENERKKSEEFIVKALEIKKGE